MSDISARYDRNVRLFGVEGQRKLRAAKVTVVGVGGLGSPLVQHLALLGVGAVDLFDDEELDETNRNRFVGARKDDPIPGSAKVQLAARLIQEINPETSSRPFKEGLVSEPCFASVREADWVFGCFDDDGPRSVLNELCAAYRKPYIDLASDVPGDGVYGGRVCFALGGTGCLNCRDLLDRRDVRRFFATDEEIERENKVYGIDQAALAEKGPSVSPLNGVVASLAATEFMVAATGMRPPAQHIEYRGHQSKVVVNTDTPSPDCLVCAGTYGKGGEANVERYLKMPQLRRSQR